MSNEVSPLINDKKLFSLGAIAFIALLIATYFETFVAIAEDWLEFGNAYGHGFLMLATVLYLLYEDRAIILGSVSRPLPVSLLLVLSLSSLWFIGNLLSIEVVQQAVLPAIILSSLGALAGKKTFKLLLFPFALIYLSIPIWDYLTTPLQSAATFIVGKAMNISGIPTHISGYFVDIPSGRFQIAGGCAGLRYLTAGMMIALLYGHWNGTCLKDKLTLFLLGIFMSLLSNWLRIFIIIIIGHLTEMKSPLIADHNNFGWILFGGMLVLYFILGRLLLGRKKTILKSDSQAISSAAPSAHTEVEPSILRQYNKTLVALFFAAFLVPLSGKLYLIEFPPTYEEKFNPPNATNWRLINSESDWKPSFRGATSEQNFVFVDRNKKVITIYLFAYSHESQQSGELIHYDNHIADSDTWRSVRQTTKTIQLDNEQFEANADIIAAKKSGGTKLVYSWYLVGNEFTSSKLKAKLLKLKSLITMTLPPTLVTYAIDCSNDCEIDLKILEQFIKDTAAQIR